VDLVAVRIGEKVVVEVQVHIEGKLVPGGLVEHVNDRIAVEAEATHIPESFTASLDGMEIGQAIRAGDVALPSGVTLVADPALVVVHVLAAKAVSEEEPTAAPELAEGEAPLEAADEDS
jgi:large subunit ribosomal protein L25